jgi:hypothetical protein
MNLDYPQITNDMATIITSGEYESLNVFDAMWEGREWNFAKNSIFVKQSTSRRRKGWGNAWSGYGTKSSCVYFLPRIKRSERCILKAVGEFGLFVKVRINMYDTNDKRRDGSINKWDDGALYTSFPKYWIISNVSMAARVGYNPPPGDVDLNYCNNLRIFRYAETLLNYVELVIMQGQSEVQGVSAQQCLNDIRSRAGLAPIDATPNTIKLERRKEFVGEGMRFWDLVRWGDAPTVLTENDPEHNSVRTFQDWMKYLPIPQGEIEKTKNTDYELVQNGQWQ